MSFAHTPQGAVGPVLADVAGSNPASGAYRYHTQDHLGSTSGLYDGAKAKVASLAYTPYGASYGDVGPGPLPRYTGHLWDGAAGLHLAPYRAYAPTLARWLSRDPLGMVDGPNVMAYARQNPMIFTDPDGRLVFLPVLVIMGVVSAAVLTTACVRGAWLAAENRRPSETDSMSTRHCIVTCQLDKCLPLWADGAYIANSIFEDLGRGPRYQEDTEQDNQSAAFGASQCCGQSCEECCKNAPGLPF